MNIKALTSPIYLCLCRLPGSGKSTFIKSLENPSYYRLLSTDNYIEAEAKLQGKTYSDIFKETAKSAQVDFDLNLEDAIFHRMNIVHDQTNLSFKKRQAILKYIPNT